VLERGLRQTFAVTSAVLFVALLAVVELSYRVWVRRSISRRSTTLVAVDERDTAAAGSETSEGAVIALPTRTVSPHRVRRSG